MIQPSNIKEQLVKQAAKELDFPEAVVDTVVSFQFREAAKAAHIHSEIEISGFGKFIISQPKMKKKLAHAQQLYDAMVAKLDTYPPEERQAKQDIIDKYKEDIVFYQTRIKNETGNN